MAASATAMSCSTDPALAPTAPNQPPCADDGERAVEDDDAADQRAVLPDFPCSRAASRSVRAMRSRRLEWMQVNICSRRCALNGVNVREIWHLSALARISKFLRG